MTDVATPKLSDKPSEVIRQALADMEMVEGCSNLIIDMNEWHTPFPKSSKEQLRKAQNKPNATCAVCMAGSVISAAGNFADQWILPHMFDEKTQNKLRALNWFRTGIFLIGLQEFPEALARYKTDENFRHGVKSRSMNIDYHKDPVQFKKKLHEFADYLESEGL